MTTAQRCKYPANWKALALACKQAAGWLCMPRTWTMTLKIRIHGCGRCAQAVMDATTTSVGSVGAGWHWNS